MDPDEPVEGRESVPSAAPGESFAHPDRERERAGAGRPPTGPDDKNAGWLIISYLVAGMVVYGGLGWLVGHWAGAVRVTTLIGVLVGLVLALTLVVLRYGRS